MSRELRELAIGLNKYYSPENKDYIFSIYANDKRNTNQREELAIILRKDYKKLTELFIQLEKEQFQLDAKKHEAQQ